MSGVKLQNNNPNIAEVFGSNPANAPVANPVSADSHWRSIATSDNTSLRPLSGMSSASKRLFDFLAGSIALMLLFPVMMIISIIIKLDSTGPALFCQPRSGRNREIIKVYKFRTMFQEGSGAEFRQASKNCLLYTSPSPRDRTRSRMPSSA